MLSNLVVPRRRDLLVCKLLLELILPGHLGRVHLVLKNILVARADLRLLDFLLLEHLLRPDVPLLLCLARPHLVEICFINIRLVDLRHMLAIDMVLFIERLPLVSQVPLLVCEEWVVVLVIIDNGS